MTIFWFGFFYLAINNPQLSFSISAKVTFILYIVYLSINLFILIKGFKNEVDSLFFKVIILFLITIVTGSLVFIFTNFLI